MKHLFKFESFDGPGEYREVNQDEWNKFYSTNKRLPMDSNDLKKLGSLVDFSRFREGDTMIRINRDVIHLNGGVSITIEKFEDEWWGVRTSVFTSVWIYNQYICDGLDSVIDFIHRINKDSRILIKSPFFD